MRLSIIVPVFNERSTILKVLARLQALTIEKEIIVVDDCSDDGSRALLIAEENKKNNFKLLLHAKNMGKGSCIKTALTYTQGDYVIIQDADLEQDPRDFLKLLEPVQKEGYKAVFGTRTLNWKYNYDIRYAANLIFAFITNILYKARLSDIMTGYKLIRKDIFYSLGLKSKKFDIEAEITAKLLRKKVAIKEVPINYSPRGYKEGKKIKAKDAFFVIYSLLKQRFIRI